MTTPRLSLRRREVLAGGAALSLAGAGACAAEPAPAALGLVATFTGPRQATGVAVSRAGRVFVNFPRWEEDVAVSVAEVAPDGSTAAYPNAAWNAFRAGDAGAASPATSFVCVQSVTVDAQDRLWALDPAAPGLAFEVAGGPKLVCVDLSANAVARTYRFGPDVAPQGSYLNDLRFTADGRRAVMTNSGVPGCLIAFDVASGTARRVLDGHPSTQFDPGVTIAVNGRPLRMADGQPAHFSADGIMLGAGDRHAYWQATTGRTMFRVPVAALFDPSLGPAALGALVEVVSQTFVADGYWFSPRHGMLLTAAEDFAVRRYVAPGHFSTLVQDPRLLWPDSMAEAADGTIYVTASHIPQMRAFGGPGIAQTQLYRFRPA